MPDDFDSSFRSWIEAFCEHEHYPHMQEDLFRQVRDRLPRGLRQTISIGLRDGTITSIKGKEYKFTFPNLPHGKEYAWLSRLDDKRARVNWEYFVQAAEYVRVCLIAALKGFKVKWEDDKMDVTLYRPDGTLLAYFEAKERSDEIDGLVPRVQEWGKRGVDPLAPAGDDDAEEKAKYIAKHQPSYFSLVSIGKRYEFHVDCHDEHRFALVDDMIPIG